MDIPRNPDAWLRACARILGSFADCLRGITEARANAEVGMH
jgi:hypothetical protein